MADKTLSEAARALGRKGGIVTAARMSERAKKARAKKGADTRWGKRRSRDKA